MQYFFILSFPFPIQMFQFLPCSVQCCPINIILKKTELKNLLYYHCYHPSSFSNVRKDWNLAPQQQKLDLKTICTDSGKK
jgi:hypothetical protein